MNEFENLSKPLIKFINDNGTPHDSIILTTTSAEYLSGEMCINTD